MIEQFRGGPPLWSPWALPVLGDRGNMAEFFVHHEDLRRAQPDWEPRDDNPERDDALWKLLKLMGKVLYRKSPVGVVLRSANRPDIVAKKGEPAVTIVGLPGEVVLHGFARPDDLIRAVRVIADGDVLLFPARLRSLAGRFAGADPAGHRVSLLSEREGEVLRLITAGLSNAEIARHLGIGTETVKSHVAGVLSKLRARDRTQAVIAAYESGFVRPGS